MFAIIGMSFLRSPDRDSQLAGHHYSFRRRGSTMDRSRGCWSSMTAGTNRP